MPDDANIAVDPRRLVQLDDDATNHLFVVEDAGTICGTAFLTLCLDPMYGFQPYGVIEKVVVHDAERRNGAGAQSTVKRRCASHTARCCGCVQLDSARG